MTAPEVVWMSACGTVTVTKRGDHFWAQKIGGVSHGYKKKSEAVAVAKTIAKTSRGFAGR